jgi:uncharacterized peroxidase-related enzyme
MARIEPIDERQADDKTRALLAKVRTKWGRSWNVTAGIANNPAVLKGFMALNGAQAESGLSDAERELISIEMARVNGCHYCVPAHRFVAAELGFDREAMDTAARGEALPGDGPDAVLLRLVRRMTETRGKLEDEEFRAFQDQGVTPAKMIAVIGEIAVCTVTNTFNRLAQTELDDYLAPYDY